jgi:hypothetical protein
MTKRIAIPIAILLLLSVSAAVIVSVTSDRATIRRATAQYRDIEVAQADGFVPLFDCIANTAQPSQGAMGLHYIKPDRFDAQLDIKEPEVLVYEPLASGGMKLAAVEYIVPAAAWSDRDAAPMFLGRELAYKTTMGKYDQDDGIDPYYEVHAWAWKRNADGMFADWNPDVVCLASAEQ